MAILGDRTSLAARVSRAKSNALLVELQGDGGAEVAAARQKGGAAVLLGFKNGGKGDYAVEAKGTSGLEVAVAATTTVTRDGTALGSIVGQGTSARIESAGGTVLAELHPHTGAKSDDAWTHRLTGPAGASIGTLTLMRTNTAWTGSFLMWTVTWDMVGRALKTPASGAVLQLDEAVHEILGDLLVAACVDMCVLPRGYLA